MVIAFSATASVGHQLAPDKSLALLPLIMQVFGAVAISFPASLIMRSFGRRKGFMIGDWLSVWLAGGELLFVCIAFGGGCFEFCSVEAI